MSLVRFINEEIDIECKVRLAEARSPYVDAACVYEAAFSGNVVML